MAAILDFLPSSTGAMINDKVFRMVIKMSMSEDWGSKINLLMK